MKSDTHTLPPLVRSPLDALRAALPDAQRWHLDGSIGGVAPEPTAPAALA